MRCVAVCQDELVVRALDQVLAPAFDVEFIVESRPLARRLHDSGIRITSADPRRIDSYLKADVGPNTLILLEDNGRRSLKRTVDAARDAGAVLIYVLGTGATTKRAATWAGPTKTSSSKVARGARRNNSSRSSFSLAPAAVAP